MMLLAIVLPVVLVAGLTVLSLVGAARLRALFDAEKSELVRRARALPSRRLDFTAAAALPPPVRRYLNVAGVVPGRPRLRLATVKQTGALRVGPGRPWMPFVAEQVYAMDPPGFVWLARARVAPLIRMMARDKFVDGRGAMLVRLQGMITVADAHGPELDQGAALRYWGEVLAFPEMALSSCLRWEPIDERRARVHVEHDGLAVSAELEFGDAGHPVAVHAERYRDAGGKAVLTPWSGHCRDWRLIDGRVFPLHWESVWHLPEGDFLAVRMETRRVLTQ